ncbi:NAD(P)-dependent dehydrogenase (short-subunit alcohol dehydrogenase family) [Kribbella voronezhensis]|uniref:NAD(P)-dependent dehydrogenase (Short-subunit alcohol dehydrogenase family) n=1 Tax=Kribbella voronezhensis TaxID=2512212 RepID=A0A4R7T5S7_9ACTN|nr:SDR family oxidoreductase [Kribbella voronezhensis]TDU87035.1 NAD(P)-dependent dehydrogenase (short-subunit alcohol dehydrogenase family) [Kribbella voronezhensis]
MNTNEVALVTGANKGIGREIARQLATLGLTVYLGARDNERGRTAAAELADAGDVRFVQLDVTDADSVAAAVKAIEADAGRLDVLVNNAGIAVEWDVELVDLTAEQLRTTYEVNVFGVATVTSACIPLLRKSPNARIVNMSSSLGSLARLSDFESPQSRHQLMAYSSSKAALNALTVMYAAALRADGIKVNAATPGLVPTDINANAPIPRGSRTVADGAVAPVYLATLPPDGPTGVSRGPNPDDSIPW